ncbi:PQQ-binding-like beta-propeller repeat protein [Nonomuraea sp. NPDC049709]|uniref:outer membrane protein assembly factor BamB family protein n=1 Tax=Nonomuraea sp. NPDC049709 TaxID=3154736 RepID=UPI00341435DE
MAGRGIGDGPDSPPGPSTAGDATASLVKCRDDRQTLWERRLHQPGMASRAAATVGRVVVHERLTRLVCLNRHDGSVRWDRPVGTWPSAVVVAGDCCLVLPQDEAQLSCLDLVTGAVRWRAGLRGFTGHVVASGSTVVVGGWRGYTPMAAFDLADGRLLWRTPQRMATVRPAPFGDGVLLGSGSAAWLIDPRDGRELVRWRMRDLLVVGDAIGTGVGVPIKAMVAVALFSWEIAERLHLGVSTVKTYVASLMRKTGTANRIRLAVPAARSSGVDHVA